MEKRLRVTLTLEKAVVRFAQAAAKREHLSLSRWIENFLRKAAK